MSLPVQGDLLRNHVDAGPGYMPDADPGRYGGGTYIGQNVEPTIEAYENIFGPSARDIKQDLQRFKRHGRWHLPDILRGPNMYLTDRVDGLITDATNSPFTSRILPYKYMENPDGKIKWNVWSFDEGLASRVPYESAARTLTQSKKSYSGYMVRQGMAIVLEHNFMMSEAGRVNFKRQLQQLVGSIQLTNDLDVHVALILAPSYQKEVREKYLENDKTSAQIAREFIDLFGFVQKNQNAMDILIEEAKAQLRMWAGPMPNFLLCNSKLTFQLTMTPDQTNYVTHGTEGQKRLRAGPDIPSYRGINVMHTRAFAMEPGSQPRDVLRRRVRVAEYYRIKPHPDNHKRQFQFYNEERDTWFTLTFKELLTYAMTNGPQGYLNPALPGKNNHEHIRDLSMSKRMQPPPSRLGAPISATSGNVEFEKLRQVYLTMLEEQGDAEFSWQPKLIWGKYLFTPGALDPNDLMDSTTPEFEKFVLGNCKTAAEKQEKIDHFDDANNTSAVFDAAWHEAMHSNKENLQNSRYLFTMEQSITEYPRVHKDADHWDEKKYPVKIQIAGKKDTTIGLDILKTKLVNYDNTKTKYDEKPLELAANLHSFMRYGVSKGFINTKYERAATFNDAFQKDFTNPEQMRFRDLGAFYCPNHFKTDMTSRPSLADLIGANMIVNQELVELLSLRTNHAGTKPIATAKFNVLTVPWTSSQYQNTFLMHVLKNPDQHDSFIKEIGGVVSKIQGTYYSKTTPASEFTKTRVGLTNLMLNHIMPIICDALKSGSGKEFWYPNVVSSYHHYWFWPRATSSNDTILSKIKAADGGKTTDLFVGEWLHKQKIEEHMLLDTEFLKSISDAQYKELHELERGNFLTASLQIPPAQKNIDEKRAGLTVLNWLAWRLWGDQELAPPAVWAADPIANIVRAPNLQYMRVVSKRGGWGPGGGGPGGGGPWGGGGYGGGGDGTENVEIVVVRPNIEHYMLGMILGFGGESLGSTFWGQTELSCYDDSMHGIWGMSYKYHSRAVVINTKNLVRLWDIAYDGYVGGKDDTWVKWTDQDELERFQEATNDVSRHYHGPSMMVMAFDHRERHGMGGDEMYQKDLVGNWPSPIVFYDDDNVAQLPMDQDHIHVRDTSSFRVFNRDIYKNAYSAYKSAMPDFAHLHRVRKNAALAAVENEVSSDALAFQGTMRTLDEQGRVLEEVLGSGHHGPDYIGVASLRAGKGYKLNSQPSMSRLV